MSKLSPNRVRVDVHNNFYRIGPRGVYIPMTPVLEKQIAVSHVQTYVFDAPATIAIDSGVAGDSRIEHVTADTGDMLLIWSDGRHKIISPKAQRWITKDLPSSLAHTK